MNMLPFDPVNSWITEETRQDLGLAVGEVFKDKKGSVYELYRRGDGYYGLRPVNGFNADEAHRRACTLRESRDLWGTHCACYGTTNYFSNLRHFRRWKNYASTACW